MKIRFNNVNIDSVDPIAPNRKQVDSNHGKSPGRTDRPSCPCSLNQACVYILLCLLFFFLADDQNKPVHIQGLLQPKAASISVQLLFFCVNIHQGADGK